VILLVAKVSLSKEFVLIVMYVGDILSRHAIVTGRHGSYLRNRVSCLSTVASNPARDSMNNEQRRVWLTQLFTPQLIALAHQHGIENAMFIDREQLISQLSEVEGVEVPREA
jgi:hypothetical protein